MIASRREVLSGLIGGGAVLGFGALAAEGEPVWQYRRLDPAEVAASAYRLHLEGGCMYAVAGSVIGALAKAHGEPYASFPVAMLRFGEGGVGGWGSTCGVVNGASALAGLFYGGKDQPERAALIGAFGEWYQGTALPQYRPAADAAVLASEAVGSILCHVSVGRWSAKAEVGAYSPERRERCRRLSADGAAHITELLNASLAGAPSSDVSAEAKACLSCHGKAGRGDVMAKMACTPCHSLPAKHPATVADAPK